MSHNLKTTTVTNDKGASVLVGEHPDSVFVAGDIDGKVRGSFYTADEAMEMACALVAAARVIRKRQRAG
jgi:hypothetical protein